MTNPKPGKRLTIALGTTQVQAANAPFNFLLVALSVFVVWGRRSAARRIR